MKMKFYRIFFETFLVALLFFVPAFAQISLEDDSGIPSQEKKQMKPLPERAEDLTVPWDKLIEKAEAYNREAIRLFEEGNYTEAQKLWQKAIGIIERSEQLRGAASEEKEIVVVKGEDSVEQAYQSGLSFFEEKKYTQAQEAFLRVKAASAGYKDTENYLSIINDLMLEEDSRSEKQKLDEDLAQSQPEKEAFEPQEEEAQFRQSVEESEKRRIEDLQAQADPVYQRAFEEYQARQFEQAKASFEDVAFIYPDYKLTNQYLERIEGDIKKEERRSLEERLQAEALASKKQQEEWHKTVEGSERLNLDRLKEEAETIYQKGRASYEKGDYEKARFYFQEVEKILSGYRSTAKFLERTAEDIAREERRRLKKEHRQMASTRFKETRQEHDEKQQRLQALQTETQGLYDEARDFYQKRDFRRAKQIFKKIADAVPGYKSTDKFLARINVDIKNEEEYQKARQKREYERPLKEKRLSQGREEKQRAVVRQQGKAKLKETLERIKQDRKARLEKYVASLYQEAQTYYKGHLLEMAEGRFQEIQQIYPGYRSTEKYLAHIASVIEKEEYKREKNERRQTERQPSRRDQTKRLETPGRIASFKDAASFYREGILLFKHKYYPEAREKFLKIKQSYPHYKSTDGYVGRINEEIRKQYTHEFEKEQDDFARQVREEKLAWKRQEQLSPPKEKLSSTRSEALVQGMDEEDRVFIQKKEEDRRHRLQKEAKAKYAEATRRYTSLDLEGAKQKFIEVEALLPGYKATRNYLIRIDEDIAQQAGKPKKDSGQGDARVPITDDRVDQQFRLKAEELFQQALRFYEANQLAQAQEKWIEVDRLIPGYKTTKDYLQKIDQRLAQEKRQSMKEKLGRPKRPGRIEKSVMKKDDEKAEAPVEKRDEQRKKPAHVESARGQASQPQPKPLQSFFSPQEELRAKRREIQKTIQAQLKQTYKKAVKLYKEGSYEEAWELFVEINGLRPGYERTESYLAEIRRKTAMGSRRPPSAPWASNAKTPPARSDIMAQTLDTIETGK